MTFRARLDVPAEASSKFTHMAKAASKSGGLSALEFLAHPEQTRVPSVCAVFGDDAFLKGEVLATLRGQVLKGSESEFGLTTFAGREVRLSDVRDALSSLSLFGDGQRLVIVEEADPFVTQYRAELEDYVASPSRGVLVLDVKTWPGNTRLAKAVAANGLAIQCDSPNERQAKSWLVQRAKAEHGVKLDTAAVDALVELVPPELGILVQEVSKLTLLAGERKEIDVKLVRENVGGWRTRAIWDLVDAAADGRAADALAQLDRIITSGEKPHGLLPQMASSLKRFAAAAQLIQAAEADRRRLLPRDALAQAGVLPFKLTDADRQLRQIGRKRALALTEWLLAADLAMKGHNSSDERARFELERLVVRLGTANREDAGAQSATSGRPTAAASR
jgi:DNA polymerase-3 subunit delta